jgi:adenine/guanine phosphoribosyltransferase-like PRPP-binding protein
MASTGETLCAVLQLLDKAGIGAEDVSIVVVAEFPVQRGREPLRYLFTPPHRPHPLAAQPKNS